MEKELIKFLSGTNPLIVIIILILGLAVIIALIAYKIGFGNTQEGMSKLLVDGAQQLSDRCQKLETRLDGYREKLDESKKEVSVLKNDINDLNLKQKSFILNTEIGIEKCNFIKNKMMCIITDIIKDFK